MQPHVFITSVTFSDGTEVPIPEAGVVAFVGPNNSGKSAALRQILEHLFGNPEIATQPRNVVAKVGLTKIGDAEDVIAWLDETAFPRDDRNTGQRTYQVSGQQIVAGGVPALWSGENILSGLLQFFVIGGTQLADRLSWIQ
jgi:hypothetical protein